ncbi:Predicted peroxiredoxins [Corynebacterium renale]|uniref:Putative peroxiredoxin n=1 Tax=Corynebacterium renale TaxID=1724 RepID=A0A2A9DQY8_9CORY|nr:DsrE family protein [Corynebacterium renale]PFG29004.1 putative peroxiredoxin [Corynebacterium renale]SQG64401.1 Predicted peroxiredoxins [Corynebacterium renale]SQI25434.1 Predicted peroxiredoxins [Corynebacterium renale]STC95163.1 Predicted peroxiredoxins [Corynebacterium renale]
MSTGKFCVVINHAKDNTDQATVGFVVANAALASAQDTMVFLSTEGAWLADKEYANDIHEEGFAPLAELRDNFVKAGGKLYVCAPCVKKRGIEESLIDGAEIVGGAKLVEFLSDGTPSVGY